ncbi:MAG: SusC/RagA family TonB-linked outer membrane protein [Porphyromonadaceae bacterium]|nr:SusC/RagA family TonB-linked outer membrane protein [Porphyromonadaceae bacterium]
MMKSVRWTSVALVCLLVGLSPGTLLGQSPQTSPRGAQREDLIIQGVVKEPDGQPAIGATIKVKGTNLGGATAADGRFSIKANKPKGEIIVSSIGFETQVLAYDVNRSLSITLKEEVNKLNEVNIVAYGKKTTRELVSSVASIKADDLKGAVAPSIESLLQGKMAGVQVTQASGSPGGGGSVISIRGINSLIGSNGTANNGAPLYVIDGVPVRASDAAGTGINPLAGLDPSTIESVQVLKDASSASLYGSRASNGVILITTKKGKSGRASFDVNVSQSFSWLPETPVQVIGKGERDFALLLARKYRLAYSDGDETKLPSKPEDTWGWGTNGAYDYLWNNGLIGNDGLPAAMQDSLNTFYNNQTNWWKYFFRLGRVTKADMNASGGTDNVRYTLGGGIYDETGIMLNSSFRRASFLTNLDLNLTPKLEAFARVYLSYTDRTAGTDRGVAQGLTVDPKGTSSLLPGRGSEAERFALEKLQSIHQKNSSYSIRLNTGLNYQILKDLRLSTSAGVDHHLMRSNIATPDFLNHRNLTESRFSGAGMSLLQWESVADYNFHFGGNKFGLMLGAALTGERMESVEGKAEGGPSNSVYYIGDEWAESREFGGTVEPLHRVKTDYQAQNMVSFWGRLSYNYKQKYLAELAFRRDGTSVYAKKHRWGTFPSVGAGWVFTSERFMKPLWWLSFGKLRGSWGRSGQKLDNPYLAQAPMEIYNHFLGVPGLIPSISANSDMTWEESDQVDLGMDLYFMNQKLRLKVDYYNKYSRNLLLQVPLPGNVYLKQVAWLNSGAVSNEGLELELSADIIKKKDFAWEMSFNIARNWNLLRQLPGGVDMVGRGMRMVVGRPIFGLYAYKNEGLVQNESDIPYYYTPTGERVPLSLGSENHPLGLGARKLKDFNGDGKITDDDVYYVGSVLPMAYGGITSHVQWKNFSLDAFFSFSLGRKMVNQSRYSSLAFTKLFGSILEDYNKVTFWTKPGDDALYPALEYADSGYAGQFDASVDSHIENVSMLRLSQLTFSYDMPKTFVSKLGVKGARVFLTGENIFLLHNYSGVDPEIADQYTGIDNGDRYPLDRKVTLGLNIKF